MSHPKPTTDLEAVLAADTAILDKVINLARRVARAAVARIEQRPAVPAPTPTLAPTPANDAPDPTLPVDRMARTMRHCIALKARLPDLYAAGRQPPRPQTPPGQIPFRILPRREPLHPLERFSVYERLADPDLLEDPPDHPLTPAELAAHIESLRASIQTGAKPPELSLFVWRETIRRTLEAEIDAISNVFIRGNHQADLTRILKAESFPPPSAPSPFTEDLRHILSLRTHDPPRAAAA